ncbi:acyl-CoA dehydrogenase family protein [Streptomyces sp. FR-108]|uniref:acyl-CoA dehydrogenase family protein n=1 Tax=Streptomyces sp. FR-108 TaxID=3416665 RepID=UPI003CE91FE9
MSRALDPLPLDLDAAEYVRLHGLLDEQAADQALTERERELRAHTRDVVAREVAPAAPELDARHEFAGAGYLALASAGLTGIIFPTELGGSADSHVAYAVVMEEITAGCAATSLVFMTQTHAAYPIYLAGSEDLKQRCIPPLLSGSAYGSMAITEPDAGSDVSSLRTTAAPAGEFYRLSGSKTFITTGDRVDTIVCFATTDRTSKRDGVSAFVVEGDRPGVGRGTAFEKLGMHGSSTAELFFDDVAVPAGNRLGAEGAGWPIVMSSVIKSRISAGAQGIGLARSAYARTLSVLQRLHGNRIPAEYLQVLAGWRGRILQGRLLLHAVARQVDGDAPVSPGRIGLMKQSCTDLGWDISVDAVRLLGPYGDLSVLGVERCMRDARVTRIYDGTNEIQRMLIGREINTSLKEM